MSETDLRQLWNDEYCKVDVYTHDGILVQFYQDMFDHCFYESYDRGARDKSILSLNRLEKILWIKEALLDKTAVLKKGWDRKTKTYTDDRRLTIVKDNYIVVILIFKNNKARFVTAYEVNDDDNLDLILGSPNW
ncbi:hypothetical protein WFZ85_04345 [Flavobacterium sp. j3]|uniref:Uncharacterized protein n=1 Tax=Flavobacterium aureirubrum TaxID=3133147 RepID=A0ABU9N280_9FLAO